MKLSKRTFKTAVMLLAMSAILFAGASQLAAKPTNFPQAALKLPKISISITFGRAKKKCGGFGICKITLGSIAARSARVLRAELVANQDGKFELNLLDNPPEEGQTLFIDQDIVLTRDGARRLGYRAVTIRQGEYAFSGNKSVLNARVTK
jgi:hypothetical protein